MKRPENRVWASPDGKVARISGKLTDMGSRKSLEKLERFQHWLASTQESHLLRAKPTGTSLLIDQNNLHLSTSIIEGLLVAFLVIAAISGLMFRSWRMMLIALVPNIIPLLAIACLMGLTRIDLKLSTSIIFTIAFGIAVDDTIHFISKLRIELGKGRSILYAVRRSYLSTGKAIIITTLILSGGFLTLIFSSFGGTY
ncbi:MAG: MMPL family transporter [Cytophagales bacterium]|nr:MMPL family transporter [Cytophagales bacterium]